MDAGINSSVLCDAALSAEPSWSNQVRVDDDACACCTSPRHTIKVTRKLSVAASSKRRLTLAAADTKSATTNPLAASTFKAAPVTDEPNELTEVEPEPQQSPIDIHEHESEIVPARACPNAVTIAMGEGHADLACNGHGFSVQWTEPGTNALVVGDKVYHAVQFHFHTPSEHTLDGVHEELELHMVHQAADGSLAVLGILFREGNTNAFLAQFWDELPRHKSQSHDTVPLGPLDPEALDVQSRSVFRYRGSLTTPPYTEGVEWIVVHDVLEASRAQLDVFHNALPGTNARDLQPLNERHVWLAC